PILKHKGKLKASVPPAVPSAAAKLAKGRKPLKDSAPARKRGNNASDTECEPKGKKPRVPLKKIVPTTSIAPRIKIYQARKGQSRRKSAPERPSKYGPSGRLEIKSIETDPSCNILNKKKHSILSIDALPTESMSGRAEDLMLPSSQMETDVPRISSPPTVARRASWPKHQSCYINLSDSEEEGFSMNIRDEKSLQKLYSDDSFDLQCSPHEYLSTSKQSPNASYQKHGLSTSPPNPKKFRTVNGNLTEEISRKRLNSIISVPGNFNPKNPQWEH